MMSKRLWVILLLVVFSISNLTGCASLKKKFTRKKKKKDELPRYYNIKKYDITPSLELYTKHYIYWKNWNRDLIDNLGKNSKKDRENVNQIIGELVAMRAMLNPPKYDDMQKHLDRMHEIKNYMLKGRKDKTTMARIRRMVETEQRQVKLGFSYNKVEPFIAGEFEWKEQDKGLTKALEDEKTKDKDPYEDFVLEEDDTTGYDNEEVPSPEGTFAEEEIVIEEPPVERQQKPVAEVPTGNPQPLDRNVKSVVFNK